MAISFKKFYFIVLTAVLFLMPTSKAHALLLSGDDLWDISNIVSMSANNRMHSAGDQEEGFFDGIGGTPGSENGNALFYDVYPAGYTHWIDWVLASEVEVKSINLVAAHDAIIQYRGFQEFRLDAMVGGSYVNVYTWDVADKVATGAVTVYGGGENYTGFNVLELHANINPVTSDQFRAYFVQAGPSSRRAGPRIFELDGYGQSVVPEPTTLLLFGSGLVGFAFRRKK